MIVISVIKTSKDYFRVTLLDQGKESVVEVKILPLSRNSDQMAVTIECVCMERYLIVSREDMDEHLAFKIEEAIENSEILSVES
jgi:hypothetical protein